MPVKLEMIHAVVSLTLENVSVWKFHLNTTRKPCIAGVMWGTKIAMVMSVIALE